MKLPVLVAILFALIIFEAHPMENPASQPPQRPTHYTLISSDGYEVIVQPEFLESRDIVENRHASEPLKAMFSSGLKEAKEKQARVALNGQALELLVNLMHRAPQTKYQEKDYLLDKPIAESENIGDYIFDMLRCAEEWQINPRIQKRIASHAAALIFEDEAHIAEFTRTLPLCDQLSLLKRLPLNSHNTIPALQVLALHNAHTQLSTNNELKTLFDRCTPRTVFS